MLQSLFGAGQLASVADNDAGAADHWQERDGFLIDTADDIERVSDPPFPDADANEILWSYLRFSDEPIFVVDDSGTFVYANEECRQLFDRVPGELMGTNLFEYDNADNSAMREVLDTGEALRGLEEEIVTDDGETKSVERHLYPLYGTDHELIGGMEINRDITERVSAQRREQQLEQLRTYQADVADRFQEWLAALGAGDYTIEPEIPEPDADFEGAQEVYEVFDQMAADLSAVVEDTGAMLGDVDGSARELDQLSEQLRTAADETSAAVDRIDQSSDEIAEMVHEQAEQAADAEESAGNLSASVEEITATAEEISTQASRAHSLADDGTAAAETAVERMETAVEGSETNVSHVRQLQVQMDAVEETAELIADIADQTNMLALNASIEAARADAGGEGFAVVANEIEGLADQTKEAVGDISATLGELQADIEETATAIERNNDEVQAGAEAVRETLERIEEIDEAVTETDEGIAQIATATDDQAANTQNVQTAIERLSEHSKTVEDQMTDIADQAAEQTDTVRHVQSVADDVDQLSSELRDDIQAFDLDGN